MTMYKEKRDPLYVDILPAVVGHIAVIPDTLNDYPDAIGRISTPSGLVPVFSTDVIVDYGENATPRYARMNADDVDAFFELVNRAPALPSVSSATPVPAPEGGE